MPKRLAAALRESGAVFYDWTATNLADDAPLAPDESIARLVFSFATTGEEVDAFIGLAGKI